MLINKTLITIAEELRFKVIKDRIFGVFDGQYICICRTQQDYLLFAYVDSSARSVIERLNQDSGICKAIGLKRGRAEFEFGHLVIHGLGAQVFPSKTKSLIKETIKNLAALLNQNQKFNNPSTEKTILVDGIPTPDDESFIKSAQEELNKLANKRIDYTAGVMLGLACSLGIGIVLGVVSWLGNKYAQADLNPIGKGFIAAGAANIIYRKTAGGVDKKSRIIVLILAILAFVVWDLTLIFLKIYDRKDAVYSLEKIVEIYSLQFLNQTTMGNYALLAIGTIVVASYFLLQRTDRTKLEISGVGITIEESIERIKKLKKLERIYGFGFVGLFIIFISSMFLNVNIESRFEYFSLVPFFVLFVCLIGILIPTTHIIFKKVKLIQLAYFEKEAGGDEKRAYWAIVLLINFFIPMTACFIVSYLNVAFDKTEQQVIQARLLEDHPLDRDGCSKIKLATEQYGVFDYRICAPEAGMIQKGDLAEVKMKDGLLKLPYRLELIFPHLTSYKNYVASRGSETDFRSNVIGHFYKIDKSAHFQEKLKEWESRCAKSPGYECRLRSYAYQIDKKHALALKLLKSSCLVGEPVSCRGMYFNEVASASDKSQALESLRSRCLEFKEEHCIELVFTLWSDDFEKNKAEIKLVLDASCKRGKKDACEMGSGLVKD